MKEQFEVTLTGSDSPIEGIVNAIDSDYSRAYDFKSIDETLHLVIGMNNKGKWHRIDGTEPYLSGWVDELAEQVAGSSNKKNHRMTGGFFINIYMEIKIFLICGYLCSPSHFFADILSKVFLARACRNCGFAGTCCQIVDPCYG